MKVLAAICDFVPLAVSISFNNPGNVFMQKVLSQIAYWSRILGDRSWWNDILLKLDLIEDIKFLETHRFVVFVVNDAARDLIRLSKMYETSPTDLLLEETFSSCVNYLGLRVASTCLPVRVVAELLAQLNAYNDENQKLSHNEQLEVQIADFFELFDTIDALEMKTISTSNWGRRRKDGSKFFYYVGSRVILIT
jgi:hypothetical protein